MYKKLSFDILKQTQLYKAPSIAKSHIGFGTFIPQIQQCEIRYCEHGGSSLTLINFLKKELKEMAINHPYVHFKIHPRPCKHPLIIGRYANNDVKQVCVKNLTIGEIRKQFFNLLNSQSGKSNKIKPSHMPIIPVEKRVA
eukprot:NODE_649_length_5036_cov_1.140571.p7 type:complete len:140 gc:universal NODE_649_length_5036_cov_1.140571:1242-1661(+)